MREWAKKEIELACKRENPDRKEDWFDYGCACYESAFKAFESLLEDEHSGFSISITKRILNRLIDGKVLTPIEDTPDVWREISSCGDEIVEEYQCKRMSELFKKVYSDGTIKYSNINRIIGVNISDGVSLTNGLISNIIDEMYPITMPYFPPDKPFRVYFEDFLSDPKNGDYDTMGIFYVLTPQDEEVEINRFFTEDGGSFKEITEEEYDAMRRRTIMEARIFPAPVYKSEFLDKTLNIKEK